MSITLNDDRPCMGDKLGLPRESQVFDKKWRRRHRKVRVDSLLATIRPTR
jgi:hypothetical protein